MLVALATLALAYRPAQLLADPDTYLHIAAGDWIFQHRSLPSADPFSFSVAGAHWVTHEWLAELVMAAIHAWLGWAGLAIAGALCFAFAVALLARAVLRRFEPLAGLIVVFAAVALLEPHLLIRAHLFALPLMVIWSAALFEARDSGHSPPLWLLPILIVWVNLHGGYMFGVALAAFLAVEAVYSPGPGSGRRIEAARWGRFVLLAGAAMLVNANGIDGVLEPFRISAMPTLQMSFIEWRSPDFQHFQPLEMWLLGAVFLGFSLGVRVSPPRLLLLLGLFHVALSHSRHADLVAVVVPLALAGSLAPRINAISRPDPNSAVARLFAAPPARADGPPTVIMTSAIVLLFGLAVLRHPIERRESDVTPISALTAARQAGLDGPVLNAERFGGYLIYSGVKVFIDGRMELYGDDFLKRNLAIADGDEAALTAALAQYDITWTILLPDDRAVLVLDHLPGWRRVYADRFAVIHARTGIIGQKAVAK